MVRRGSLHGERNRNNIEREQLANGRRVPCAHRDVIPAEEPGPEPPRLGQACPPQCGDSRTEEAF